jgi:chlorobactene glucosyltransferase
MPPFSILHPQWGIIFFLGLLLLIAAINLLSLKRVESFGGTASRPLISVLVPARNEAHNIEACLSTLLNQEYEPYEVLVLDDQSEDGTGEIINRISLANPSLKVLRGLPLPEGWVGKPWACHQLFEAAKGELFLFTDADTRHHPSAIKDAAAALESMKLSFLSGFPRQDLGTWGERLGIPMLIFIIFSLLPLPLARRLPLSWLSAAVGQFILIRRDAYERVGGHAAVKNTSVEDFALARLVKAHRLRWDFMDLTARVRCRMYHTFAELFNGISKNLLAVYNGNFLVFSLTWLWMVYLFVQPLVGLSAALAGRPINGFSPLLGIVAVGISFILWWLNNRRFHLPLVQAFLYPVTALLYLAMVVRVAGGRYLGKPQQWKGRDLPDGRSGISENFFSARK